MVVRGIANRKVENLSDDLALVVVRNAAVGPAIIVIFFKPSVQAGFLHALPQARRTRVELADLRCQICIESLFRPNAAALERVGGIGARDAFGEPKRARVLLLREIHGFERLRSNSLHVPSMKELMRGYRDRAFHRSGSYRRAVRVFHSPAATFQIRTNVKKECVLAERSSHQFQLVRSNLA